MARSTDFPSAQLAPGGRCSISEGEWFHFLQAVPPLHQWANAFLLGEAGEDGCVRVYLRDDSGQGRHLCLRLDPAGSRRARAGVQRVEAASAHAADVISANQAKAALSPADLAAEQAASRCFTEAADGLYRELLGA